MVRRSEPHRDRAVGAEAAMIDETDLNISPARARELVAAGAHLIDVRTTDEFHSGAVRGAVNVPLHTIPMQIFKHISKGDQVVLYCLSGGRSGQAARWLRQQGVKACYNAGGVADMIEAFKAK
jgi:phage shock protein E